MAHYFKNIFSVTSRKEDLFLMHNWNISRQIDPVSANKLYKDEFSYFVGFHLKVLGVQTLHKMNAP